MKMITSCQKVNKNSMNCFGNDLFTKSYANILYFYNLLYFEFIIIIQIYLIMLLGVIPITLHRCL